ncbi:methyltransferase domain-containing protein [Pseudoluteimonas lycopersici]|uniref:Methyltransferase domain-containing protein n=1 Tax=Pseudoluteimonas lycopersici TaxID=1324796 RepID=A0A516V1Z8_9GAMM|nr:methyltransferase domain-containing protein [Lysobacter lycopersici]QDQ72556.1 methyltransferase domain-containing protein [Lysobacter lycopersici]
MPPHYRDRLRFFAQWLRNPRRTAAVAPSGTELVAAILAELPDGARRVIELGGGTGAVTRALLASGIPDAGLLVVELNAALQAQLRIEFPEVRVALGDAAELPRLARESGYLDAGPADAIVSGLGLLAMEREAQARILRAAFECLRPDGALVQFTYGPLSPVRDELRDELGLIARHGAFVLRNVPPATVWVYRRNRARAIKPRSVAR